MIDGDEAMRGLHLAEHRRKVRHRFRTEAKVDELRWTKDVGVPAIGGDLAPRDQQQLVEVGLQLALAVELRNRVVVTDGDEIETARRCGFERLEQRAGDSLAALAVATAVA